MTSKLLASAAALAVTSRKPRNQRIRCRWRVLVAIRTDLPGLMAIYRDLHANPELVFQEARSADHGRRCGKAGFDSHRSGRQDRRGRGAEERAGAVVLIRADMDGLPVIEQTGLPLPRSRRHFDRGDRKRHHARLRARHAYDRMDRGCAAACGAARSEWSGTLVMIGQPAEELGLGARAMLGTGSIPAFPSRIMRWLSTIAPNAFRRDRHHAGYALANVDSSISRIKGSAATAPFRTRPKIRSCSPARS